MRYAIFLAAEAWREHYGQIATESAAAAKFSTSLQYTLPSGQKVTLPGWREEKRRDARVYVGPDGEECDNLHYAWTAMENETRGGDAALRAMRRIAGTFKEGHDDESLANADEELDASNTTSKMRTVSISQLDDYFYRGDNPIVKDMSLYVYSMWVYRVESQPFQAGDASARIAAKPRAVDIPFDTAYPGRTTWVQRLSLEPRVPKPDGMQFAPGLDESMEMHCMTKSLLFTPRKRRILAFLQVPLLLVQCCNVVSQQVDVCFEYSRGVGGWARVWRVGAP